MNSITKHECQQCGADDCDCCAIDLIASPFVSLKTGFGMLLGVDDFDVLAGNPRGKGMLHNAWLHGDGVVWGFAVHRERDSGDRWKLRIGRGLAIDGRGRELHRDSIVDECLDLGCWLDDFLKSSHVQFEPGEDGVARASVCLSLCAEFTTCQGEPVEALLDPCDPSRSHTQFSRVFESVRFQLDHRPPVWSQDRFHGLRVLLGLAVPHGHHDQIGCLAAEYRRDVDAAPVCDRRVLLLDYFRKIAARCATAFVTPSSDADPCGGLFPTDDDSPSVLLASVFIDLVKLTDCTDIVAVHVDTTVRTTLLPTNVIQEFAGALATTNDCLDDACGPRLVPGSVCWDGLSRLGFALDGPVIEATIPQSVIVTNLSGAPHDHHGWRPVTVLAAILVDSGDYWRVELDLGFADEVCQHLRVVFRGTGSQPLVGVNGVPFAGLVGGPGGSRDSGHDVELMVVPS
jgi:hypothetical protein